MSESKEIADNQFQNYINVKLIDLWVDAYLSAMKDPVRIGDPKGFADQAVDDFKLFLASGE